jgi:hypothetical protein
MSRASTSATTTTTTTTTTNMHSLRGNNVASGSKTTYSTSNSSASSSSSSTSTASSNNDSNKKNPVSSAVITKKKNVCTREKNHGGKNLSLIQHARNDAGSSNLTILKKQNVKKKTCGDVKPKTQQAEGQQRAEQEMQQQFPISFLQIEIPTHLTHPSVHTKPREVKYFSTGCLSILRRTAFFYNLRVFPEMQSVAPNQLPSMKPTSFIIDISHIEAHPRNYSVRITSVDERRVGKGQRCICTVHVTPLHDSVFSLLLDLRVNVAEKSLEFTDTGTIKFVNYLNQADYDCQMI